MNLDTVAGIAEIASSICVIASLVFVGFELRKNNIQSKLDNWSSQVDRFVEVYGRASNLELGELIAKGRASYVRLSDGEKISYGHHLEQLCLCLEAMLHAAGKDVHARDQAIRLFEQHIRHHLGCTGGLEWWREFQNQRGFRPFLTEKINLVLDKMDPEPGA
jgi:hypothetical protein